jgi:hypothetical protein
MKSEYGFVILVLVAVIITAGCVKGTVSVSPETVTYQQPATVATYSQSTSSTYSPQSPTHTTTISPIKTFSVGESASDGNIKFTVNSINFKDKIGPFPPDKGYHYLVIDVSVENLQKEKIANSWIPYSVNDADGYTYESYYISSQEKLLNDDNILPGETRRGNILFIVPIDSEGLKLKYNFGQGQIAVFNI